RGHAGRDPDGSTRRGTSVMATKQFSYDRIPYLIVFDDDSDYRDTYGGVTESVVLESFLMRSKDVPSDTVIVFMHPIGGGAYLPMSNALPRAGHHVIYCNSRYRGVDSALIMEKVVQDLGACVRDARERWVTPTSSSPDGAGAVPCRCT